MFLQITISQWKNYKMSGTKKATNLNLVKDKEKNKTIPLDQVITLDHLTNPDKK